jgi:hypothetical protein
MPFDCIGLPAPQLSTMRRIMDCTFLPRRHLASSAARLAASKPPLTSSTSAGAPAFWLSSWLVLAAAPRLLVRFIGSQSSFTHPMHIHWGPFRLLQADGFPVSNPAQIIKDTVDVAPGERYHVLWDARETGAWLLHCHINQGTTNDSREE